MKTTSDSKVASFSVDHRTLKPGIYLRSQHKATLSWDIRLYAPSEHRTMTPAICHTLEHIFAHALREDPWMGDKVIAWCPMGCLTGFYLVTDDSCTISQVREAIANVVLSRFPILGLDEVPGMNEIQCGNPTLHDVRGANETLLHYMKIIKPSPME